MDNKNERKIDVFLLEFPDPRLGPVLGCDLRILDESASVAQLLDSLDQFAAARLADCRGCDGCCQERAPLTSADVPALAALVGNSLPYPVHAALERFAQVEVNAGVSDIYLRREQDGVCRQLDRGKSLCRIWPSRAFVCRSHFCLPRSPRLELLRQAIVNQGLNQLTRLILAEEAQGAPPLTRLPLAQLLNPEDYPANAFTGKRGYEDIRLKDCVEPRLWRQLTADA